MEILTQSAQETYRLGQKIADYIIKSCSNSVIPASEERARPESETGTDSGVPATLVCRMTKKSWEKQAVILALYGELGSGKTTFVKGLAKGLGLPHRILSPTFIIVRRYELHFKKYNTFYHIDLYRTENEPEMVDLGLDEIFAEPASIVAIEWAEKLKNPLPTSLIHLTFTNSNSAMTRMIAINPEIPVTLRDLV